MEKQMNRPKEKKDKAILFSNPLAKGKYRNDFCPCGSGKKVKKCHGTISSVKRGELDSINKMIHDYVTRFDEALKEHQKTELERLSKGDLGDTEEETKDSQ